MADLADFVFFSTLHLDGRSLNDPHLNAGSVKYHNKHSIHVIFAASLTKIMDEPCSDWYLIIGGADKKHYEVEYIRANYYSLITYEKYSFIFYPSSFICILHQNLGTF